MQSWQWSTMKCSWRRKLKSTSLYLALNPRTGRFYVGGGIASGRTRSAPPAMTAMTYDPILGMIGGLQAKQIASLDNAVT
jgi:hypothetical protein